jgi:hypothetical protein
MGGFVETKELGLKATTMAIREVLMEYFKGTCIERLTDNHSVRLINGISSRGEYQYIRREQENQRPMIVMLNNIPIATVQHAPEKIIFHQRVLTRSPEFREIYKELKLFMDKYLVGVEAKHSRKGVFYAS